MPIYEFECDKGHRTEGLYISLFTKKEMVCQFLINNIPCGRKAEKVWSAPANIQIGKPTRVFENKHTGETMVASSDYDQPPKGCTIRELKGPIERSKFEHEEQIKLNMTNAIVTAQIEEQRAATKKNRHDDINSNLSKLASDSDNPSGAEAMIKSAMKRNRPKKNPRRSEVHLAVNHSNASNLSEAK